MKAKRGFTLVEILIVVVILGILAAIVVPAYAGYQRDSHKNAFIASLKNIASAASYHYQREGEYFEDSSSGTMPVGLDTYMRPELFTNGTPIGGVWDFELDSYGVRSAFGVHFDGTGETRDDAYMLEIDSVFDDGNLNTGAFRKLDANRYYYIVAAN